MTQDEIIQSFERSGVILKGHFLLSSGLHSDMYMQCAKVFENPLLAMKLCEQLCENIRKHFYKDGKKSEFNLIVSPAIGGIVAGYEVARQLLCKNCFVERVDNIFTLRRGFEILPEDKVLIVEDVITTGKSTMEAAKVVESFGAKVVGVACLVDRISGENLKSFTYKENLVSLVKMEIETYAADNLPQHLRNTEAIKPGSRKIV